MDFLNNVKDQNHLNLSVAFNSESITVDNPQENEKIINENEKENENNYLFLFRTIMILLGIIVIVVLITMYT